VAPVIGIAAIAFGFVLDHLPAIAPARAPPIFCAEIDQAPYEDDNAVNPTTDDEFDQTVSW